MIVFRKAIVSDINFLISLRKKTMQRHFENLGIVYYEKSQLKRVMYEFQYAEIIVLDSKDIGLLKFNKSNSPWEIIQIQISPEYQKKGFGDFIIKKIIVEAENNKTAVELDVLKSNPAQKLYERNGFIIIGEDVISYRMRF